LSNSQELDAPVNLFYVSRRQSM